MNKTQQTISSMSCWSYSQSSQRSVIFSAVGRDQLTELIWIVRENEILPMTTQMLLSPSDDGSKYFASFFTCEDIEHLRKKFVLGLANLSTGLPTGSSGLTFTESCGESCGSTGFCECECERECESAEVKRR